MSAALMSGSAPRETNRRIASALPLRAAWCSNVCLAPSLPRTGAPAATMPHAHARACAAEQRNRAFVQTSVTSQGASTHTCLLLPSTHTCMQNAAMLGRWRGEAQSAHGATRLEESARNVSSHTPPQGHKSIPLWWQPRLPARGNARALTCIKEQRQRGCKERPQCCTL